MGDDDDDHDDPERPKNPLSEEDVRSFVDRGFVRLRRAFSPEAAAAVREFLWRERLEPAGISRTDPSTWVVRHGVPEVFTSGDGDVWRDVLTPRLFAAIDQLVGEGRWNRRGLGLGWWVVSFPGREPPPWGPSGRFHVDGAGFRHFLDSREQALLPVFLFSDVVGEGEGGTALAVGSHEVVARTLRRHRTRGLSGGALSREVLSIAPGVVDDLAEARGDAGDVVLLHPFLLHARSKNLGPRGVDSVRFACFPAVQTHEPLRVGVEDDDEGPRSPVEIAIVRALERGGDDDDDEPRQERRKRNRNRNRNRNRKRKRRRKGSAGEGKTQHT